ncbi:response regulator transcription factor [Rhodospirillaceae bacterium KN72]|uniref:Response regulator transcription factor n=1 Tax=Pacificispira spongiicola TaxID=2729598 RepID=A0A7Y0HF82_9PROT|nr:DNA-binding response regulator [Pacificispira spongiicola]NMM45621.1 response regulator transcription factor [Pacificispira spongiicola]
MTSSKSIVFVDDEPQMLAALKRSLRSAAADWDMAFYDDPLEALKAIAANPPDVAVMDIRMPKMSGVELARAIKAEVPEVVCMVLSGSTDFEVAVDSINSGHVFRYFVKPCATETLVQGIQDALVLRAEWDDAVATKHAAAPSLAALEVIPYGVVVVGEDGRAQFTNARAGAMLAAPGGLSLDSGGICRAVRLDETEKLQLAIASARETGETSALSLSAESDLPIRVTVQPYRVEGQDKTQSVCLFLFSDEMARALNPKLLNSMFGLTVAESRLAAALAQGLSLDEAAQECGVTKSSARTYLKNIFSKLGVTRQAELVRTILTSLA